MKPISMWIVFGMSLLLVTGAIAQPPVNDSAASVNLQPGTPFPTPDILIEKSSELPQIKLLKQSRVREVGLQPEPPEGLNVNVQSQTPLEPAVQNRAILIHLDGSQIVF